MATATLMYRPNLFAPPKIPLNLFQTPNIPYDPNIDLVKDAVHVADEVAKEEKRLRKEEEEEKQRTQEVDNMGAEEDRSIVYEAFEKNKDLVKDAVHVADEVAKEEKRLREKEEKRLRDIYNTIQKYVEDLVDKVKDAQEKEEEEALVKNAVVVADAVQKEVEREAAEREIMRQEEVAARKAAEKEKAEKEEAAREAAAREAARKSKITNIVTDLTKTAASNVTTTIGNVTDAVLVADAVQTEYEKAEREREAAEKEKLERKAREAREATERETAKPLATSFSTNLTEKAVSNVTTTIGNVTDAVLVADAVQTEYEKAERERERERARQPRVFRKPPSIGLFQPPKISLGIFSAPVIESTKPIEDATLVANAVLNNSSDIISEAVRITSEIQDRLSIYENIRDAVLISDAVQNYNPVENAIRVADAVLKEKETDETNDIKSAILVADAVLTETQLNDHIKSAILVADAVLKEKETDETNDIESAVLVADAIFSTVEEEEEKKRLEKEKADRQAEERKKKEMEMEMEKKKEMERMKKRTGVYYHKMDSSGKFVSDGEKLFI